MHSGTEGMNGKLSLPAMPSLVPKGRVFLKRSPSALPAASVPPGEGGSVFVAAGRELSRIGVMRQQCQRRELRGAQLQPLVHAQTEITA